MMVGMDELELDRRQFWMPALVAAVVVFGGPLLYVLGYTAYAVLTGQRLLD